MTTGKIVCSLWRNAEGDLKDKQMDDFILTMDLKERAEDIDTKKGL